MKLMTTVNPASAMLCIREFTVRSETAGLLQNQSGSNMSASLVRQLYDEINQLILSYDKFSPLFTIYIYIIFLSTCM